MEVMKNFQTMIVEKQGNKPEGYDSIQDQKSVQLSDEND